MPLKILIVGCGAMGGIFASALASAAKVTAYDTDAEHVRAINANGLKVDGSSRPGGRFSATDDAATLKNEIFDAAVFLVKSKITATALAQVRPHLAGNPVLITLQNGMGNAEVLLTAPGAPVVRGVTMNAGRYVEPGRVESLIEGKTWLGPIRGSLDDARPFAEALTAAGMPAELLADPMGAVWSKFVLNCVQNPVGALVMGDNAARYDAPEMRLLIDDMADECMAVIKALGGIFAYPPMEYVHKVRAGEVPMSKHGGSMALDIARGVPTEIDELTGFIVREGERLGVPTPNCRAVSRLLKGLEQAAQRRVVKLR